MDTGVLLFEVCLSATTQRESSKPGRDSGEPAAYIQWSRVGSVTAVAVGISPTMLPVEVR